MDLIDFLFIYCVTAFAAALLCSDLGYAPPYAPPPPPDGQRSSLRGTFIKRKFPGECETQMFQ